MYYNSLSSRIVDTIYNQSKAFMGQYGGHVESEENPYKTIYLYSARGVVLFGYEFRPDSNGGLTAIKCFGSNFAKDLQGMQQSGKIFELPILRIDTSNIPNSVIVYL